MKLPYVIAVAFIGTLCGDQLYFYLGRHYGQRLLARHRLWRVRARRIQRLLHRHQVPLMLGYRFVYGVRTVTPFVLGLSRINPIRFLLYNAIGALIWALMVSTFGYALGHVASRLLGDLHRYQEALLLAVVTGGSGLWLWHRLRTQRASREV